MQLVSSNALAAQVLDSFSAASAPIKSGCGQVDGSHYLQQCNGSVGKDIKVSTAGEHLIQVEASGTPADGAYPIMEIWVNYARVARVTVGSTLKVYSGKTNLSAGTHQIAAAFMNDSGARDLRLGKLTITSNVLPAPTASATATPVSSGNLVLNPGFESDLQSWTEDWTNSTIVTSGVRSGSKALRIGTAAAGRAQTLAHKPVVGASYTLKGSGRMSVSGDRGYIGVHFRNGTAENGQAAIEFTGTSYADKSVTFVVPANTTALRVFAWKGTSGGYLFADDISLVQLGASPSPSPAPLPSPSPSAPVSSCRGSGSILLERWDGVQLTDPTAIPFSRAPSASSQRTLAEAPSNFADNYGQRLRGLLCVPESGNYVFNVAGDDQTSLFLSTDDNPANKRRIAYHTAWTGPREWNKYATQKSAAIPLVAGKQYYIEALQVEQGGGDNLAIGWTLPNGTAEMPIPGSRLTPVSEVAPNPSPTVTSSPSPTPTATSTSSPGTAPTFTDSFDPNSVTYSGPLLITRGGTYSGRWQSTDTEIPAVDIQTDEPVIIENSVIRGAGYLVKAWVYSGTGGNVTIRNSRGYGIAPTPWKNYIKARVFLTASVFKNIVVENNYIEHAGGVALGGRYIGNGSTSESIRIRYNKVKNIDGRIHGAIAFTNFLGMNFRGSVPHVDVSWNQIYNQEGNSSVEDNINFYNSRGTSGSPMKIHNNFIEGAYPTPGSTKYFSGGGIILDSADEANTNLGQPGTASAYIDIFQNQVIRSFNYSFAVAGGNNIKIHENRAVTCGITKDGRRAVDQYKLADGGSAVFPYGIYGYDFYSSCSKAGGCATFNVSIHKNVVGVNNWDGRFDYGKVDSHVSVTEKIPLLGGSNKDDPNGQISCDLEQAERNLWFNKVKNAGIHIGPR